MPNAPDAGKAGLPVATAETAALFSCLTPFRRLGVAVSGGADSLCLLVLLAEWQHAEGWPGHFHVMTVDHGLRPESGAEAASVAAHCARLGLTHETLTWCGEKSGANLQAEARRARYRLMGQAMEAKGLEALVLGHHQDDQIETFLDRLTRGSGVYGLSAMKAQEARGATGHPLMRPLLEVPKSRLTATLLARGLPWCEDPSNENRSYKRVRLRALAQDLALEGFETARLIATARRMARAADALDAWVSSFDSHEVERHPAGPLRLKRPVYAALPEEVRLRLLGRLVRQAGAHLARSDYPLREGKLEGLDACLLAAEGGHKTLHGCHFSACGDWVMLWPEMGRVPPPAVALNGMGGTAWDNRFQWQAGSGPLLEGLMLGPLALAPEKPSELAAHWAPKQAFDRAPALWAGERLLLVPGFPPMGMAATAPEGIGCLTPLEGALNRQQALTEGELCEDEGSDPSL